MMNKSKGNMYGFVTHTWNVVKGKCPHDCSYCYMKQFPQGELRFDEKEMKTNLGEGNFIFVGSSCDMWARAIPFQWIEKVLTKCRNFDGNVYLFQTKDPSRFCHFKNFPSKTIFGTTIETNREDHFYKSISRKVRASWMSESFMKRKMISIEPIMDFDLEVFVSMIENVNPEFVSIGADSKRHNLPEPSAEKIKLLISELEKFTKVIQKDNLKRIDMSDKKIRIVSVEPIEGTIIDHFKKIKNIKDAEGIF